MAARARAWRKLSPEKAKAAVQRYQKSDRNRLQANRRRSHIKNTYGITVEEYEQMLAAQNNRCAICKTDKPSGPGKKLFVDHDHETGTVRGLLCCKCNFMIGHAVDGIPTLRAAVRYLKKYQGG